MSREPRDPISIHMRFPRVSGDEPEDHGDDDQAITFSPRERG